MTVGIKARACVQAAVDLGPEDTARFLELHDSYVASGMKADAAAKAAAQGLIAEIEGEAQQIGDAIKEIGQKKKRAREKKEIGAADEMSESEIGEFRRRELLTELKKAGGVNIADVGDILGEHADRGNKMMPTLFRKRGGLGVDTLAQWMQERGYLLPESAVDGIDAGRDAAIILRAAILGEGVFTIGDLDDVAIRRFAEKMAGDSDLTADEAEAAIDLMPDDLTLDEVADAFDGAAFLQEQGITDIDAIEAILDRAALRADDDTSYEQAVREEALAESRRRDDSDSERESEARRVQEEAAKADEVARAEEAARVEAAEAKRVALVEAARTFEAEVARLNGEPALLENPTPESLQAKEERAADETIAEREIADRERANFALTAPTGELEEGATQQGTMFTVQGEPTQAAANEQGMTAAELAQNSIDGFAEELAAQITGDIRDADFSSTDAAQAVRLWATDRRLDLIAFRDAVLTRLLAFKSSIANTRSDRLKARASTTVAKIAALVTVQGEPTEDAKPKQIPLAKQSNKTYWMGNAARFTGQTRQIAGGKFFELEILDGASKGRTKWTQRGPTEEAQGEPTEATKLESRTPTFYSELSRQVEGINAKAMTPGDWSVRLRALKVKPDELHFSGVLDWLATYEDKTTKIGKENVTAFLDANGVRVEETVLGDSAAEKNNTRIREIGERLWEQGYEPEFDYNEAFVGLKEADGISVLAFDDEKGWTDADGKPVPDSVNDLAAELAERSEQLPANGLPTKFSGYQLPGGTNYRELLLTLPDTRWQEHQRLNDEFMALKDRVAKRQGGDILNLYNERDRGRLTRSELDELQAIDDASKTNNETGKTPFRSSHFDQANVLAHVRFNERRDADGQRVLFIEEVQSDWAQKGRREGFVRPADETRFAELARESEKMAQDRDPVTNRMHDEPRWHRMIDEMNAIHDRKRAAIPAAPFVGKTDAWVALSLKRMIRYAAENGFDRVAWTTGEQQAARYDLSKQVEHIDIKKVGADQFKITAWPTGRGETALGEFSTVALEGVVGKELAKKISDWSVSARVNEGRRFTGVDLKVGGEGMKAFYDTIVPKVANDLLKKLGGGRVGEISVGAKNAAYDVEQGGNDVWFITSGGIPVDGDRNYRTEAAARKAATGMGAELSLKQPGFDITPQMRETAMAGQALFTGAGTLDYFTKKYAGTAMPEQALADARAELERFGLELPDVAFGYEYDEAADYAVMSLNLDKREIIYNTANPDHSYELDVQAMVEELLHAVDSIRGSRTLSASMKRLAMGGDLRAEVMRGWHSQFSQEITDFLDYPLNSAQHPDLSPDRVTAELYARLGVLYIAQPEVFQQIAPRTYEAYDGIFRGLETDSLARARVDGAVQRNVPQNDAARIESTERLWQVPGQSGVGDEQGSTGQASSGQAGDNAGSARQQAADRLEELRQRSVQAFGGDPAGAVGDYSSLESRTTTVEPTGFGRTTGGGFDIPAETRTDKFRRYVTNQLGRLDIIQKVVREQGGDAKDFGPRDIAHAAERFPGMLTDKIDRFTREEVKPLLLALDAANVTPDELALYAYAKHAPERNAEMQAINGRVTTGSGMTDADAAAIIERGGKKLAALHEKLQAITKGTRDLLRDEGLISEAEHAAWSMQYANYVPLKGFASEITPTSKRTGSGFSIRGKESLAAMGRDSRAGQIIENILLDRERAVIRAEKNRVGKVLLDFVLSNPDENLWEVEPVETKPRLVKDADGMRRVIYENKPEPGVFVTKVGGAEVRIKLRDSLMERAMLKLTDESVGPVLGAMTAFGSYLSRLYTGLNPTFVPLNGARDFQAGLIQAQQYDARLSGKIVQHYPGAFAASLRFEYADKRTGNWDKWFDEYSRNGGRTGFMALRSLEDKISDVQKMFHRHDPNAKLRYKAMAKVSAGIHAIEGINGAVENTMRVAAYRGARELGKSEAEAASIAKNITVNFNRRGELTKWIAPFFLFYNAAVQGTAITVKAMKNPRVQAIVAALTGGAMAMALVNVMVGGEDDDEIAYWDKIDGSVKERNLIIMLPPGDYKLGTEKIGTKGRFIKVPLPYGFSPFVVFGNGVVDGLRYMKDPSTGQKPMKAALQLVSAVFNSYNPTGGENPQTAIMPIAQPWLQAFFNRNRFGNPLYPEPPGGQIEARAEQFFESQKGSIWQTTADWLNRNSGGNAVRDGYLSIQPAILDNTFKYFTGGLGQFGMDLVNPLMQLNSIGEADTTRLPFVRQLYGEVKIPESRRMYQSLRAEAKRTTAEFKALSERGEDMKDDGKVELMLMLGETDKSVSKALIELRKQELYARDDESLTKLQRRAMLYEIEAQRKDLYGSFLSAWKEGARQ